MNDQPSSSAIVPLPAWRAERRVARRLQPHEVPWIRHVQPLAGDTARLVNISSSGVLVETTARLQPGRRGTVVIVDAVDTNLHADGEVVRTQLVSVGLHGELIYQTAMRFPGGLDLRVPLEGHVPSVAEPLPLFVSRIDGPLPGEWLAADGPRPATITNIAQTGCCLQTDDALGLDQFALLRVRFGPSRVLMLSGTVVAVDEGMGCLLRFEDLTADTERALKTELLTLAARAPRDLAAVFGLGRVRETPGSDRVVMEWQTAGREGSDPAA